MSRQFNGSHANAAKVNATEVTKRQIYLLAEKDVCFKEQSSFDVFSAVAYIHVSIFRERSCTFYRQTPLQLDEELYEPSVQRSENLYKHIWVLSIQ